MNYKVLIGLSAAEDAVAKAIYRQWSSQVGYLPWVDGGNSHRQELARDVAYAALSKIEHEIVAQPVKPAVQPLTDEQDRALCESHCNAASDEYFAARQALDFPYIRLIFEAGHRKAWIAASTKETP